MLNTAGIAAFPRSVQKALQPLPVLGGGINTSEPVPGLCRTRVQLDHLLLERIKKDYLPQQDMFPYGGMEK